MDFSVLAWLGQQCCSRIATAEGDGAWRRYRGCPGPGVASHGREPGSVVCWP